MPDSTRIEKWINQIGIDYYSYFIKSWIPFNAWYRENYPTFDSDRAVINHIKKTGNTFKAAIESLLTGNDEVSQICQREIENLHLSLCRANIECKQKYKTNYAISFSEICVENNPLLFEVQSNKKHSIDYYVRCYDNPIPPTPKYVVTVKNRTRTIFCLQGLNEYNEVSLKVQLESSSLNATQKANIIALYQRINPWYPTNLLYISTRDEPINKITCGKLELTSDLGRISSGIIEILYLLRNSLMHGELHPTKDTILVYKSAYNILASVVEKMI